MRSIYFLISLTLASFLFSCGNDKEKKANDTVVVFLDSLSKGNVKGSKVLVTDESKIILEKVEKDQEKYQKQSEKVKKLEVKTEIVEKKISGKDGDVKVKITCDGKEKIETLHLIQKEENWLIVVPETQVSIIQFIVFSGQYEKIVVMHEAQTKIIKVERNIRVEYDDHKHKKDKKHHDNGKHKGNKK